ncbi:MAG: urease accessory protein UreE [Verrucomicrobiota bacterium]
MHVIQHALALSSALPVEKQITLAAERRQFLKRRWRGIAEDGTEFGFDLESRLTDGCVIFQQAGNDYVVRQLPEMVYEIRLETPAQAALVGWKVGNLHLPAQILDHSIRILHDEAMTQLLEREGWAFTEPEVLFTPLKAVAHSP